jgi:hypothetical protein
MRTVEIQSPVVFLAPPQAQGQTEDVSYAGDSRGGVVKRVHDLSDRTVRYYVAALDWARESQYETPGLNREPYIEGEWEEVNLTTRLD